MYDYIDETITAKAFTALGLAVGTTIALSTKTVLDKSGFKDIHPVSTLTTRRIGGSILSFSLAAYFLVFQDASASTAIGISCIPWIVELSKTLFDGTHKELEIPAEGQVFVLVVTAIFSYLFLNDSPISAETVLRIYSGWTLLNGVLMGCFPKLACKTWGNMDAGGMAVLQSIVSLWGFGIISLGALSGCLSTGMMTNKALVVSAIPFISRFAISKFV